MKKGHYTDRYPKKQRENLVMWRGKSFAAKDPPDPGGNRDTGSSNSSGSITAVRPGLMYR